jgi:hypothetical protein
MRCRSAPAGPSALAAGQPYSYPPGVVNELLTRFELMIGGPVDMLIETGIKGRPHLEPPLEDVIIAKAETRPAPEFSKK